jgi:hypothetical protein
LRGATASLSLEPSSFRLGRGSDCTGWAKPNGFPEEVSSNGSTACY